MIVVTSGEESQTRQKAFDLGATDSITKPFDSVPMTGESGVGVLAQRLQRALRGARPGGGTGLGSVTAVLVPDPADRAVDRHLQRLGWATASVISEHGGGMVRLRRRPAGGAAAGLAAQR